MSFRSRVLFGASSLSDRSERKAGRMVGDDALESEDGEQKGKQHDEEQESHPPKRLVGIGRNPLGPVHACTFFPVLFLCQGTIPIARRNQANDSVPINTRSDLKRVRIRSSSCLAMRPACSINPRT